jgi:hypothetical protein
MRKLAAYGFGVLSRSGREYSDGSAAPVLRLLDDVAMESPSHASFTP